DRGGGLEELLAQQFTHDVAEVAGIPASAESLVGRVLRDPNVAQEQIAALEARLSEANARIERDEEELAATQAELQEMLGRTVKARAARAVTRARAHPLPDRAVSATMDRGKTGLSLLSLFKMRRARTALRLLAHGDISTFGVRARWLVDERRERRRRENARRLR